MNNIEQPHVEIIRDILTNRPNIEGKFINYNQKDKEQLRKIIAEQKQDLKTSKPNLTDDCYNDLIHIYDWLLLLLDNSII